MNRLQVILSSLLQKRNKIIVVDDANKAITLPKGAVRYYVF
jgi:hypothetical protein